MTTIFIDPKKILGFGNERACFIHPTDPSKCIKVNQPGIIHRNQNKIEDYYLTNLKNRNVPFTYLSEYYGEVDTDWGKGLMFERIMDDGHSPSIRLDEAIKQGIVSRGVVKDLLNDLNKYLVSNAIYIGDCNKDQLLLQRDQNGMRLKVIDGLGTRNYGVKLKLLSLLPWYARIKMKIKWPCIKKNYQL
ncbi:YrbL family protein [Vibrio sp. RC27]